MSESTRVTRFLQYLQNNPVTSTFIIIGIIITALANFKDSVVKLWSPFLPVPEVKAIPRTELISVSCRSSYQKPNTYISCFEQPKQLCSWLASDAELSLCDGQYGAVYTENEYAAIIRRVGKNIHAEELWYKGSQGSSSTELSDLFQKKYAAPGHKFRLLSQDGRVWAYE